jgi:valyl-tRNA synthetase
MKNNVPLGKKVVVNVKTDAAHIAELKDLHPIISTLAGLESLSISSDAKPGADAAVGVSGAFEIYLEGAIDREKEKVRLTDQHAKLSDQIGKLRVRLENQDFISRAKPEIIAKHKKELEVAEAELGSVARSLQRLG